MQFSSPQETMQRLAVTIRNPSDSMAFHNDSFSYIAKEIKENPYRFMESDEIVLLGKGQQVGHMILVRGDEILYDRQRGVLRLPSYYDPNLGEYTTKLNAEASNFMKLRVVGRFNLTQFKIDNGFESPAAPASSFDYDS